LIFGKRILKRPEDPLAPIAPVFQEAWHAQTLAAAHALEQAGSFSKSDWAEILGAALAQAEARGAPDTEETYYLAALQALETLAPMAQSELEARKEAWEKAYLSTPHGSPVTL
jgi:nitrile hydratase accessory protein